MVKVQLIGKNESKFYAPDIDIATIREKGWTLSHQVSLLSANCRMKGRWQQDHYRSLASVALTKRGRWRNHNLNEIPTHLEANLENFVITENGFTEFIWSLIENFLMTPI